MLHHQCASPYISNLTLHFDLKIKTIHIEAIAYYKRLFNRLPSNSNTLMSDLATHTIARNQPRCLKEIGAEIFLMIDI